MSHLPSGPHTPQHRLPWWRRVRNDPGAWPLVRLCLIGSGVSMLALVVLVLLGGCSIPTTDIPAPSTPAKQTTAAPLKPTKPAAPSADPNKATIKAVGAEFTVGSGTSFAGKYTVLKGWTLREEYGVPQLQGKVRNAEEEDKGKNALPNLQIKFVKGSELLMSFTCTANELEPGQTAKLNCFTTDDFTKGYTAISAETGL